IDGKEYVTPGGIQGASDQLTIELTEDEVFLLCDNRDEKIDSRNKKLGPVDMRDIKGNVLLCVWPFSDFGGIE
ncbi:MAG: S26 family signal peptidase, partial [Bacillota bacterium]|nr:S26 family signal peptidase [Bacillota bacterium]